MRPHPNAESEKQYSLWQSHWKGKTSHWKIYVTVFWTFFTNPNKCAFKIIDQNITGKVRPMWKGKESNEVRLVNKESKTLELLQQNYLSCVVLEELCFLSWSICQHLLSQPAWRKNSSISSKRLWLVLSTIFLLFFSTWNELSQFLLFIKLYLLFKVSSDSTSALTNPTVSVLFLFELLLVLPNIWL